MFRIADLMNNTAYSNRITYAPPDDLGADNNESEPQFDEIPDSDADGSEQQNEGRRKIKDDDELDMSEFFNAGDDDEDDEGDSLTPEEIQAQETQVGNELKATLDSLTLPTDLIPEDFDASDRTQLLALMNRVQTHTATNAVRAMLKPVQATLVRMATQLRQEQRQLVRDGIGKDGGQRLLAEEIPASGSKVHGPLIKQLFRQAQAKHPKDARAAIAATKKAMKMLDMNPDAMDSPNHRGNGDSAVREGTVALDEFLGFRLPPAGTRSADRIRK